MHGERGEKEGRESGEREGGEGGGRGRGEREGGEGGGEGGWGEGGGREEGGREEGGREGGTCLMVTAGLQSLFSSSRERHTVPEGYTFGWNRGGSNLPAANTHTHTQHKDTAQGRQH